MMMKGTDLTTGTPWKVILVFALPVLVSLVLQQLYSTVDMVVVGNFTGEDALSAVGTMGSVTFLLLAVATGFSSGAGILVAQRFGARDEADVRSAASTSVILLILMGLIMTLGGILFSGILIDGLLAVPGDIRGMASDYLVIYCIGLVFQFGYNIFASVLRGVGDSRASMYFLLIATIVNVILDMVLVAGLDMGVAGAAVATDVSQLFAFAASAVYMFRKYPLLRFSLKDWVFDKAAASKTISLGFPIFLQMVIVSMGIILIQRAVNGYGVAMMASFTVGSRIEMYVMLPFTAFQTAMATYSGQNFGAGRIDRVRSGTVQVAVMSLIITVFFSLAVILMIPWITELFSLGEEASGYCASHLKVTALSLLLLSTYIPVLGMFQGAGDGFAATRTATIALGVRVLTTYTLCNIPEMGYRIIWWNMIFGFVCGFTITWIHYLRGKWAYRYEKKFGSANVR